MSSESDYESSSSTISSVEISEVRDVLDISFDPKIITSDHESDWSIDEEGNRIPSLSTAGYRDEDTDSGDDYSGTLDTDRTGSNLNLWCKCGECSAMDSDLECYCCRESNAITEGVIGEEDLRCVTETTIFKNTIENKDVLELTSYSSSFKLMATNEDGRIKNESLRFAGYRTFLNICAIRNPGRGRKFVLLSCVVNKIRRLYPLNDGIYRGFIPGEFNSRI